MGLLNILRDGMTRMFRNQIEKDLKVTELSSTKMKKAIKKWYQMYTGEPDWVTSPDDDAPVKTINFAKAVCEETARLTTLAIKVNVDGPRKDYLQKFLNEKLMPNVREWTEYGCAWGTVIFKPDGDSVALFTPDKFMVTSAENKVITGIVFQDDYIDTENELYYTRFEYHHYIYGKGVYEIINKTYVSKSANMVGDPVDLKQTIWSSLKDVSHIVRADDSDIGMLFGVFRMPGANNIALNSCLGMSIFSNAVEEIKDLDVAYSRNAAEIYISSRSAMVDDRLLAQPPVMTADGQIHKRKMKMPKWIRNVTSDKKDEYYQEINPDLRTDMRITGINNILSFIGFKCGYSNGYFVLDEKTGMVTATQVESDDRRTIQLIKDIRDCLQKAIEDCVKAQAVMADLYDIVAPGEYELSFIFGDITYNYEEDKQSCWKYVQAGKYPLWRYYVRFEGMSEEEAKAVVAEAKLENRTENDGGLFGNE